VCHALKHVKGNTVEEAAGAMRRSAFPLSQEEMSAGRGGESEYFNWTPEIVLLIFSPSSACII